MAKDRLIPCEHYTAFGEKCLKGRESNMKSTCNTCKWYKPKRGYKIVDKRRKEKYKYFSLSIN